MALEPSPDLTDLIFRAMTTAWWQAIENPRNENGFVFILGPEIWKLFESSLAPIHRFTPGDMEPWDGEPVPLMFRGTPVVRNTTSNPYHIGIITRANYDRTRAAQRQEQARLSDAPSVPQWPEA